MVDLDVQSSPMSVGSTPSLPSWRALMNLLRMKGRLYTSKLLPLAPASEELAASSEVTF